MLSDAGSRAMLLCLLLSVFLVGIPAFAGTVDVFSNLINETNSVTGTDVAIPVSPAWAPEGPGYEWISYGNTGCNTYVALTGICTPGPQNPAGITGPITSVAPTAIFYKTFTVTGSQDVAGNIQVWADDVADFYIDSGTITSGTGSTGALYSFISPEDPDGNCNAVGVGCLPGKQGTLAVTLAPGTYTLVVDAWQYVGGSPFGVMYDGVLTADPVPEPASYMLLGLGLAGLGVLARRKRV